jgi:GDP-4-dehydro-6-deoxy-D-mannose reductase
VSGLSLVTGATGFAGSHLIDHLLEVEPAVAAWSHRGGPGPDPAREPGNASRVQWCAVDLMDRLAVARALADLRPSAIYHCAGIAHVGESWSEPERALRVNVLGTHHLLEGVRNARLDCSVLVTGSALVYKPSALPLAEDDPIGPNDPYGMSKLAQEMVALRAGHASVFVVRPFNHAGPRQASTYVTSSLARQIAEVEVGLREPVLHVGNLEPRRDITDVRDTVRAYRLVVLRGRPARPYNVCSGQAYRVRDLLDVLVGLSRASVDVAVDPARLRPSDNPVIAGDRTRIGAETGWMPQIPIERTLGDLLDYWRHETSRALPRRS